MSTLINEIVHSSFEIVNESHDDKKTSITSSSRSNVMVSNEIIQMSWAYHLLYHHFKSFHSISFSFIVILLLLLLLLWLTRSFSTFHMLFGPISPSQLFFFQYILQSTIKWMLFIAHWCDLFSTAVQHGCYVSALSTPSVHINFLT